MTWLANAYPRFAMALAVATFAASFIGSFAR
jgi:hypothetical protein